VVFPGAYSLLRPCHTLPEPGIPRGEALGRLIEVQHLVHMSVRVVVAIVKHVGHVLRVNALVFQEAICLFDENKVFDHIHEYSSAPFGCKFICVLLCFGEGFIEGFTKDLVALVFVRLVIPLFPDLVESAPVHRLAAHGTRRAVRAFEVPILDTSFAENVTAAQFLEGTTLGVAH